MEMQSARYPPTPTWPSTMEHVKEECAQLGPKVVIQQVSEEVGGVCGAYVPGELPRNEKQVTNTRKLSIGGQGPSGEVDELFVVMQRAYSEDPQSKFIRAIRTSPDAAVVLAEIKDIERFCTSSTDFGILAVDPTFSLGEFDVTPITYRHLLLVTKRNGKPPAFIGPVLIHYRKTFAIYLFFHWLKIEISYSYLVQDFCSAYPPRFHNRKYFISCSRNTMFH